MSISNNIAEGSGSFSDKEFASFLNISRRSVFECANILQIFLRRKIINIEEKKLNISQLVILSKKITTSEKPLKMNHPILCSSPTPPCPCPSPMQKLPVIYNHMLFLSLFAIVGFALYGLPFFYDFFSKEFGWSRTIVTSGNALGKLLVAPLFGFIAGWLIDRYGPRKMLMTGALLTGTALIGLSLMNSLGFFYLFYVFNALGYVFGGPLPCQVLISRWFTTNRGKAMGIAYLGIGTGGFLVPLIASGLEKASDGIML